MKKFDPDTTLDLPEEEFKKAIPGGQGTPGQKASTVRINDTDIQIFVLLLHHKFLSFDQLARRFSPKQRPVKGGSAPAIYHRLYRMVQEEYLHSIRKEGAKLFLLAEKGIQVIRDFNKAKLPVVALEELSFVKHDLAAADLRFYFESLGAAHWTTERQLERYASGKPKIPDAAFRWNGRAVFLEVEFSQKSRERYERIYAHYAREGGPDLALYFFKTRSDLDFLIRLSEKNPRFAFFPYSADLPSPEHLMGSSCLRETTLQDVLKGLR